MRKHELLERLSQYDILNYYLSPYHNLGILTNGKNISNPFLSNKQETPSFNIYQTQYGNWRYNDFATGDNGDCFEFVMKMFGLGFVDTMKKIVSDMYKGVIPIKKEQEVRVIPFKKEKETKPLIYIEKPFTKKELEYWGKYGIDKSDLQYFGVVSLYGFSIYFKEKRIDIITEEDNPIFAYKRTGWLKTYRPLAEKKRRFLHLGIKPFDYIFGYDRLPWISDEIIITGGEKDVISLYAHGKYAITFNSETSNPPLEIMEQLKHRFKKVCVLYDNDETGERCSNRLSEQFGIEIKKVPEEYKDVSDYFAGIKKIDLLQKKFSKNETFLI